VVAAGTAALSLAGPFALRPFVDVAGAAGTVSVAFVLDFGGSPATLVTGCVTVPDTATRYDALSAFTASKGLALPVYDQNGNGLLCSINGVPSSGCGQIVPVGHYIYWSYFTGGPTGWSYANSGAFGTVAANDVEGWRFQDPGLGNPRDPAPRSTAVYRRHCSTTPPTTTKKTRAPAATNATTTGTAHPHTTAPVGSGGSAGSAASKAAKAAKAAKSESLVGSGSGSGTVAAPGGSGSSGASAAYPPVSIPPDPEVGVVAAHHVTPGGGPDPLIAGGILAAGLAVAAWARWRRRPRTP
jgi:hypothetical protein